MNADEFNELVKSKISQADFAFTPEDYHAMQTQLVEARRVRSSKKIVLLLSGIAACMLLVITIAALSRHTIYPAGETIAKQNIKKNTPVQNTITSLVDQNKKENKRIDEPIVLSNSTKQHNRKENTAKENTLLLANAYTQAFAEKKEQSDVIRDGSENKNQLADNKQPHDIDFATPLQSYPDIPPPVENEKHYSRKINISLAGAYNYGASSQGYLLGASVRKDLSKKLYVEGDVAYTNSSTQRTVNTYSAPSATTGLNVTPPVVTAKENTNTFNYLQLSPAIGYHIHKKIAVGVGADIQRLLQNNTSTTSVNSFASGMSSETGKTIPDMDYGIIGKTEYSVSPRLKAGFQYREGMNNFLSNTTKYFDRNYFQVQIKYSLFNK